MLLCPPVCALPPCRPLRDACLTRAAGASCSCVCVWGGTGCVGLATETGRRRVLEADHHITVLQVMLARTEQEEVQERGCTLLWHLSAMRTVVPLTADVGDSGCADHGGTA